MVEEIDRLIESLKFDDSTIRESEGKIQLYRTAKNCIEFY